MAALPPSRHCARARPNRAHAHPLVPSFAPPIAGGKLIYEMMDI